MARCLSSASAFLSTDSFVLCHRRFRLEAIPRGRSPSLSGRVSTGSRFRHAPEPRIERLPYPQERYRTMYSPSGRLLTVFKYSPATEVEHLQFDYLAGFRNIPAEDIPVRMIVPFDPARRGCTARVRPGLDPIPFTLGTKRQERSWRVPKHGVQARPAGLSLRYWG
jgi:hypothetical protein